MSFKHVDLEKLQKVYFIGIGGISMSSLARYFKHKGCTVAGYDKTPSDLTKQLEEEGIPITFQDSVATIPPMMQTASETTLVIYTPAVPANLDIFRCFTGQGFTIQKRAQVLGVLSRHKYTIAVAGTHGKTTISCMIVHILKCSGRDCSAFLGGIAANYNSNLLLGASNLLVVEADEYDRSFLTLHPDIAVITAMDADHLDIYGTQEKLCAAYQLFAKQIRGDGRLLHRLGLPFNDGSSYSIHAKATAFAENKRIEKGTFYFDFRNEQLCIKQIRMGVAGTYNIENAVAAIQVCLWLGVDPQVIPEALSSFKGVKRRFEYILNNGHHIFVDDYAHHPEEIRACIASIRELYPGKKLTAVFQAHLYTRTRDFAAAFAAALDGVDVLLMLPIYPARELAIPGVNAALILNKMRLSNKRLLDKPAAIEWVQLEQPELLVTLGAGDIDQLVPLFKNALNAQ